MKEAQSRDDFDELINGKNAFVLFKASWCKVCQSIFPVFEDLEKHYGATLFMVVDVDENEAAAVSQGVDAMPTFVAYRNGNKVDELMSGDEARLKEFLAKHAG
uniref:Thioredoxin domain-containing protein n=1 Tax=Hanusia phi TaxID=3032 RepID=A0A7S0EJX5_9CRYP|mmetsp:Transcript_25127/g.56728  ORF Transcript_25127/g.56728 Transcript_25127/m.56728 type:complete len:103 (+) Transcript_25127:3-311(+)